MLSRCSSVSKRNSRQHQGHLTRSAVELAKDWRSDRILRRLEAMLAVADRSASLIITGTGDVLEPEQGIVAIGSGGAYAQAAARALLEHTALSAAEIVKQSLTIAGDLCIYTNQQHVIETLECARAMSAPDHDVLIVGRRPGRARARAGAGERGLARGACRPRAGGGAPSCRPATADWDTRIYAISPGSAVVPARERRMAGAAPRSHRRGRIDACRG